MYSEIIAITSGEYSIYKLYPGDFLVFGRGKNADVVLDDSSISRLHCKVFYHEKQFWIQDFGSRNSTLVNKNRVSREPLNHGDQLRLGRHAFKFYLRDVENHNSEYDEQESFSKLKRQDKLFGKVALELKLLERKDLEKSIFLQKTLNEDNDKYINLEDILVRENILSLDDRQQINKFKIKVPEIEGYKLQELIGIGGMGKIYKGRDHANELVAIKVLSDKNSDDKIELNNQFIREAKAIAKLHHPNIVAGLDFGFSGKNTYIVMEFVDGPTLQQYIKEKGGRLLPDEALNFIIQITNALEHAHSCHLVHRDIKTENILLASPNSLKLCDFGLVKNIDESVNKEEKVFGTIAYMSPEQCLFKKNIDIRSDIYSLGVVFYRLIYGELPFKGSKMDVRKQHVQKPLKFPEFQSEQRKKIAGIILRMMAKNPKSRYQTPSSLLKDLHKVIKNFAIVDDIDGTAEECIEITYSSGAIDDTATRIVKVGNSAINRLTQKITSFELVADLKPPAIPWRYITGGLIICLIWAVTFFSLQTGDNKYYKLAMNEINKNNFQEATPFVKKLHERNIQKLQENIYPQIREMSTKNIFQCISVCRIVSAWDINTPIADKILTLRNRLQREISSKEKEKNKENSFSRTCKQIEKLIAEKKIQQAERYLIFLYKQASTRNQRETYDKLYKRFEKANAKKKTSIYKYFSNSNITITKTKSIFENISFHTLANQKATIKNSQQKGDFFTLDFPFLYKIQAKNGQVSWIKKLKSNEVSLQDAIFIRNGSQTKDFSKIDQVLLCNYKERNFHLINSQTGQEIWSLNVPFTLSSKISCFDSKLYFPSINQHVYCINLITRQIEGSFFSGSKCIVPPSFDKQRKTIYLSCYDGYFYAFNNRTKKFISRISLPQKAIAASIILGETHINFIKNAKGFSICQYKISQIKNKVQKLEKNYKPILSKIKHISITSLNTLEIETLKNIHSLDITNKTLKVVAGNLIFQKRIKIKEIKLAPIKDTHTTTQRSQNSLYIQKNTSQGIWCGVFDSSLRMVWSKRLGVDFDQYFQKKKTVWISGKDGRLYCGRLGEKFKFKHYSGHPQKEIPSSFSYIKGKKEKILISQNIKKISLFYFKSGKKFKRIKPVIKTTPNANSLISTYKNKYAFIASKNKLNVISLKSGKQKYRTYISPENFTTNPIFIKGYIYIATEGNYLYKLKLINKSKKPYIKRIWRFLGRGKIQKPIITKKRIYIADSKGYVYALDRKNGRRKWQVNTRANISSPPIYKNKRIYTCNNAGHVYALTNSGEILWKKLLPEKCTLTPYIQNENIYIAGNKGTIFKLDIEDGVIFDTIQCNDTPSIFFGYADKLYLGNNKGFLYILSK